MGIMGEICIAGAGLARGFNCDSHARPGQPARRMRARIKGKNRLPLVQCGGCRQWEQTTQSARVAQPVARRSTF